MQNQLRLGRFQTQRWEARISPKPHFVIVQTLPYTSTHTHTPLYLHTHTHTHSPIPPHTHTQHTHIPTRLTHTDKEHSLWRYGWTGLRFWSSPSGKRLWPNRKRSWRNRRRHSQKESPLLPHPHRPVSRVRCEPTLSASCLCDSLPVYL